MRFYANMIMSHIWLASSVDSPMKWWLAIFFAVLALANWPHRR